jgi:hypothetical protein
VGNWQEHFDAKLIDLCECQDRGLLSAILAGIEEPLDDNAVNRAAQGPLFDDFLGMLDLEARNFHGEFRFLELPLGNLDLRFGLLQRFKRADRLFCSASTRACLSRRNGKRASADFNGRFVGGSRACASARSCSTDHGSTACTEAAP